MHFSLVVVDYGTEMLAIETDADTVVSGAMVKGSDGGGALAARSVGREQELAQNAQWQKFSELMCAFPEDNASVFTRGLSWMAGRVAQAPSSVPTDSAWSM